MKLKSLACALSVTSLVVSASVGASAQADPFMGAWRLNTTKSTFSPGPAPKSGTATFTAIDGGQYKALIEGVGAKDEKVRWEYTGSYDGKDYPMKGNPEGDAIAIRRINANTVETTFKMAGKTTVTNIRTVSADGKTMTVTAKGTNTKGQPVHNVQVFERN